MKVAEENDRAAVSFRDCDSLGAKFETQADRAKLGQILTLRCGNRTQAAFKPAELRNDAAPEARR
jgi:hypothetical protein